MKEREEKPVLFSAPMVRAILSGTKTQTRRVVKPQPEVTDEEAKYLPAAWDAGEIDVKCPYGSPGTRLWVRESFIVGHVGKTPPCDPWIVYAFTEDRTTRVVNLTEREFNLVSKWKYAPCDKWAEGKARPGMFLLRSMSRITLEITNVRVERLQEISEEDAIAEGILEDGAGWQGYQNGPWQRHPVDAYQNLWESIKGSGSWEKNPFCWVVTFRKV